MVLNFEIFFGHILISSIRLLVLLSLFIEHT